MPARAFLSRWHMFYASVIACLYHDLSFSTGDKLLRVSAVALYNLYPDNNYVTYTHCMHQLGNLLNKLFMFI